MDVDVFRLTGLNVGKVTLRRIGANLQVKMDKTGETVTIDGQLYSQDSNWELERMQFADGTSWDLAAISAEAWFRGTSWDDAVSGISWNDTLAGGGGDDTLTGGAGANRFVFGPDCGKDVITDFTADASGTDMIEFSSSLFSSFAERQAAMARVGSATAITRGADTLTLNDTAPSAFVADDFRFA